MPITHAFVNPVADEPGFAGTKPSDWNADHSLSGDDTQLQYNNAGSIAGARIKYTDTGGEVILESELESDNGMGIWLKGVDAQITEGHGGDVTLQGGEAPGSGDGGSIFMHGGDNDDNGNGGNVEFQSGSSPNGHGGDILFKPGEGVDDTSHGRILFRDPASGHRLHLDVSELNATRKMTAPNASFTVAGQNLSNQFSEPQFLTNYKSGADQASAGAAAGEIWATSGHATLPDNVLMIGV